MTVAAGTTVSVLLAGWFPDEGSLAVHVQADGEESPPGPKPRS